MHKSIPAPVRGLGSRLIASLLLFTGACFEDEQPLPGAPTTTEGTTADPGTTSIVVTGSTTSTDPPPPGSTSSTTAEPPDGTTVAVSGTSTGDGVDSSSGGCQPMCMTQDCGVDPLCGVSCGRCDPADGVYDMGCVEQGHWYCGQRLGYPDILGMGSIPNGNIQFGYRVTLNQPRQIRALGVLASGAGVDIRMALYANDEDGVVGGPTERLAVTGSVGLVAGYNDIDINPRMLDAGDYWVMVHTSTPPPLYRSVNDDYEVILVTNVPYDPQVNAFPMNLGSPTPIETFGYTLYIVVED